MPRGPRDARWSHLWRRVRGEVLARDGWVCQINAPGCTIEATEVDHIIPLRMGGAPYELSNLRAACVACNRGARQRKRKGGAPGGPASRAW